MSGMPHRLLGSHWKAVRLPLLLVAAVLLGSPLMLRTAWTAPKVSAEGFTGTAIVGRWCSDSPSLQMYVAGPTSDTAAIAYSGQDFLAAVSAHDYGDFGLTATTNAADGTGSFKLDLVYHGENNTAVGAVNGTPITLQSCDTPACGQWSIAGKWDTYQGNNYAPVFQLQQQDTSVTGTAELGADEAGRAGFTSSRADVRGSLVGNHLDLTVTWAGRSGSVVGHYQATVFSYNTNYGYGPGVFLGNAGGSTYWVGYPGDGATLTCTAPTQP